MPVSVKLSPLLRKYINDYEHEKGILIERFGMPVDQLVEELNIPPKLVTSIMVNYKPRKGSYVVQDGDQVLLAMIIGGG